MAKTYADIQKEIVQLQQAAESARRKEVAGVVGRIKAAIAAYGITARDLGLEAGGARGPRAAARRDAGYRDAAGNTWSGRGRRPGWVHEALAAGKTLEQLRA